MTSRRQVVRGAAAAGIIVCTGAMAQPDVRPNALPNPSSNAPPNAPPNAPSSAPIIVPFPLRAMHWDHHWFVWLPRHPRYEAVEIMSRDGPGGMAACWVFFTERQWPKRQHSYTDNQALATQAAWTHALIRLETRRAAGEQAGPLDCRLEVQTRDGPVRIVFEFEADARLSARGGGLTPQIGHGEEQRLLLFHRGAAALATRGSVLMGGVDVSEPVAGVADPLPFHAAYSRAIHVAAIPYGRSGYRFGDHGEGTRFIADPRQANRFIGEQDLGTTLYVEVDDRGGTRAYGAVAFGQELRFAFEPALVARGPAGGFGFVATLSDAGEILRGTGSLRPAEGQVTLDWRPESPVWTRRATFTSTLGFAGDGAVVVTKRSA